MAGKVIADIGHVRVPKTDVQADRLLKRLGMISVAKQIFKIVLMRIRQKC